MFLPRFFPIYSASSSATTPCLGRLSKSILQDVVKVPLDADFYFCGPRTFMLNVRRMLIEMGVKTDKIHFEFFGPTPEY